MPATGSILVIDHEPTIVDLLLEILTDAGYVAYAAAGARALAAIATQIPALILLDMHIPGLSVAPLIAQIRAISSALLPVVLMTTGSPNARPLQGAEAFEYLAKPFDIDDLLACVGRYVQPYQAADQASAFHATCPTAGTERRCARQRTTDDQAFDTPSGIRSGRAAGVIDRSANACWHEHAWRKDLMSQLRARILVVDDEAVIRSTLDALLQRQGYDVWTAANGAEAFAWLHQGTFDLLVIDLMLPGGVSGLDIAATARMSHPDAAVLILTGSSELADAVGYASVHQFATMLKTASPQEVLARVATLIAQQPVPPQL